ncbi:MAG: magnesium transporter [Halobacteria archaeon]
MDLSGIMRGAGDFYKKALPVLLVSIIGSILAGTLLAGGHMRSVIKQVPGLLLILPAFLATRGNVYGSLGARISTGLHQGFIEPELEYNKRLLNAMMAALLNGLIISVFVAASSTVIMDFFNKSIIAFWKLVSILLVASFISGVTLIIILVSLLFVAFKRGMDPDTLIGPIMTTAGDIFGVAYLYISVILVGWVVL